MMSQALKGHFISDLHLFSRRSTALSITGRIRDAFSRSHTMVLGGDIFDFRWSIYPTLDSTIHAGICWLEELINSFPACNFYYLLGNHDAHPRFVSELDRLAFRQPRLSWQPFVLRIHECVFLHGDILDGEPTNIVLAERRKLHERKPVPRRYSHWLYDLVVHFRLHRAAVHIAIRPKMVLRKLTEYLEDQGLDSVHGVRDVYFGHTHRVLDGVQHAGLTFHNGGASIRGLPFRIIETRLPVRQCDAPSSVPFPDSTL
jgi:UDP-2,3-diacylglucosamine pyrophosphatase LpxH